MSPTPQELVTLCQEHGAERVQAVGLIVLYFRGKKGRFLVKAYGDSEGGVLWAPLVEGEKEVPFTRLSREQFIEKLTSDYVPVVSK